MEAAENEECGKEIKYIVRNRKAVIIGAGFVGSSIAYALALRDIDREIVLIDIDRDKTAGEAKISGTGFHL